MGVNVNLTPQLEDLVRSKVASGLRTSASEVVREALRKMDEQNRLRGQSSSSCVARSAKGLKRPLSGPRLDVLRVVQGPITHRLDLEGIDIGEVLDPQFAPHLAIRMRQVAPGRPQPCYPLTLVS